MKKLLFLFLILILLVGGLVLYARFVEPAMLQTKYVQIPQGPKLRVAFFSDTHFGKNYPQENIERIVEKINSENPDIVVFGGDFIDNYGRDSSSLDTAYLGEQLAAINGAKFAVLGNHDYGGGAQFAFKEIMELGGFQLLVNEIVPLDNFPLTVIGYDELYFGTPDPSLLQLSTSTYNLLIAHQPDIAKTIVSDTPGILLGGHSHGGQVGLPFIEPFVQAQGAYIFKKGLYAAHETDGNNQVFVSSGIGTSIYPVRFLNMPEVVIMDFGTNAVN